MPKTFKAFVSEDIGGAVAANNAGGGQIAGIGVGPQGEPGGSAQVMGKKKKPFRRSSPVLENVRIFDATPEKFHSVRYDRRKHPRMNDYMGTDQLGESIKTFARENPDSAILLRNSNTREIFYLKY